jgi:hypothetical protein
MGIYKSLGWMDANVQAAAVKMIRRAQWFLINLPIFASRGCIKDV